MHLQWEETKAGGTAHGARLMIETGARFPISINSAILHHHPTAQIRKTQCQRFSSASSWTELRALQLGLLCRVPGLQQQSASALLTDP